MSSDAKKRSDRQILASALTELRAAETTAYFGSAERGESGFAGITLDAALALEIQQIEEQVDLLSQPSSTPSKIGLLDQMLEELKQVVG